MNRVLSATLGVSAASLVVVLARRRYTRVTVRGHSMNPTLHDGQRVLAVRRRHYRVGDIVVFRVADGTGNPSNPGYRVKRIIAVAGEPRPAELSDTQLPDRVPAGRVAVAGDNAGHSQSSRQLGYLALADIRGRVVSS